LRARQGASARPGGAARPREPERPCAIRRDRAVRGKPGEVLLRGTAAAAARGDGGRGAVRACVGDADAVGPVHRADTLPMIDHSGIARTALLTLAAVLFTGCVSGAATPPRQQRNGP